jgi:hypothetical protein
MIMGGPREVPETTGVKQKCADCGAADASWCSLNWGISVCLKCSGAHRQLSSSTSKVRSVQLDKLHSWIQDMLILLSNDAANNFLLANKGDLEIGPRTDEAVRIDYITRKYQKKEWAITTSPPDPFEAITGLNFLALLHAMNFGRADDKFESMTPLHAAVQSGDPVLIAIAACCSVDLDVPDSNGWTPFCYALFYGDTEAAKFLLSLGAKPDKAKIDLLTLALYNGDREILEQIPITASAGNVATAFTPVSTKFAMGKRVGFVQIAIPPGTRKMSKLYREAMTV